MMLSGKVALVTGAGRGIGQAIALAFAREGAKVAVADIDPGTAQATARRIGRAKARALQMDVADSGSVRDGFDAIDRSWGRIDVAVTNAAVEPIVPFLELSEATWDRIIDVNLKGTFLVAQAAARRMARRRRGVIITLSSVNAEVARPESAAYAATKGGVRQLTKAMAIALAPHGIRVNAIGPGTVVTGLTRHLLKNRRWRDAVYARTPMQRVAEPQEIAEVAVFLASDASSYMTGSTVYVDGGRLALNGLMPPKGATPRLPRAIRGDTGLAGPAQKGSR
ncbi:MAG: dehydrogenase [Candidatus Rokuibacteriota bacterium]|nr:MAG: dehydrogenase [Candidatus Rokubacteria bacterium]PYM61449.1 MAG: dehydrogenase [Candidatus Rokubacteria bacterium]PYN70171.1 MAG: dehydrogenase [Candidatus Rokubacteria bacterium]